MLIFHNSFQNKKFKAKKEINIDEKRANENKF
jgi:hypothetical protein